ncbi:hypothetical protein SCNRRL3882_0781 [Streptomyces chartreusis NRRL 3882]|uniref:MmyB-like transcription regulator ligand binding domain-containing protein n=1 Tax=Streptomyces chartreusis NRRL 3882 TaxID=1079985 RepID=A0A2N9B1T7_STRCX|nr:hypothetical protein SCNRRL3882_0781 [Streptomyces chartreusis NRRL 3882]
MAEHNVRLRHTGRKAFRHPVIGARQPGLALTAYSAEPRHPGARRAAPAGRAGVHRGRVRRCRPWLYGVSGRGLSFTVKSRRRPTGGLGVR